MTHRTSPGHPIPLRSGWRPTFDEHRYRVAHLTHVTPAISELILDPLDEGLTHRAGQYLLLTDQEHRLPERSYSIANAPREDRRLRLLITRYEDGRTSPWASSLQPGETVTVEGPFGSLTLDEDRPRGTPTLLLAAGAGLAPLAALAEALLLDDDGGPVALFTSARTEADMIDRDRYLRLAAEHPRLDYHPVLTRPTGRPRGARLPQRLSGLAPPEGLVGWDVFVAGPSGFVTAAQRAAVALGAAPEAVHTEEFFADPVPRVGGPGVSGPAVSA